MIEPPDAVAAKLPHLPESPGVYLWKDADGAVLYVQEPGSHVGKRSEHLVVRKDGAEVDRVPIHGVRQVVCGNVRVSTRALETLVQNEVPVAFVTGHGRFIERQTCQYLR